MHVRASKGQRFVAYLIDFLMIGFAAGLINNLILRMTGFQTEINAAAENFLTSYRALLTSQSEANLEAVNQDLGVYLIKLLQQTAFGLITEFVIAMPYFIILPYYWDGKTVGRNVAGVKVVNKDGSKPSISILILREFVGTFILYMVLGGIFVIVSAIVVLVNNKSLVDYISKTELEDYKLTNRQANENSFNQNDYNNDNSNDNYNNNDYGNYSNSNDSTDNTIEPNYRDVSDEDEKSDDNNNDEYKVF